MTSARSSKTGAELLTLNTKKQVKTTSSTTRMTPSAIVGVGSLKRPPDWRNGARGASRVTVGASGGCVIAGGAPSSLP